MRKTSEPLKIGTCKALRGEREGQYFVAFRDSQTVTCIPYDPEDGTWRGPVHLWKTLFIVIVGR